MVRIHLLMIALHNLNASETCGIAHKHAKPNRLQLGNLSRWDKAAQARQEVIASVWQGDSQACLAVVDPPMQSQDAYPDRTLSSSDILDRLVRPFRVGVMPAPEAKQEAVQYAIPPTAGIGPIEHDLIPVLYHIAVAVHPDVAPLRPPPQPKVKVIPNPERERRRAERARERLQMANTLQSAIQTHAQTVSQPPPQSSSVPVGPGSAACQQQRPVVQASKSKSGENGFTRAINSLFASVSALGESLVGGRKSRTSPNQQRVQPPPPPPPPPSAPAAASLTPLGGDLDSFASTTRCDQSQVTVPRPPVVSRTNPVTSTTTLPRPPVINNLPSVATRVEFQSRPNDQDLEPLSMENKTQPIVDPSTESRDEQAPSHEVFRMDLALWLRVFRYLNFTEVRGAASVCRAFAWCSAILTLDHTYLSRCACSPPPPLTPSQYLSALQNGDPSTNQIFPQLSPIAASPASSSQSSIRGGRGSTLPSVRAFVSDLEAVAAHSAAGSDPQLLEELERTAPFGYSLSRRGRIWAACLGVDGYVPFIVALFCLESPEESYLIASSQHRLKRSFAPPTIAKLRDALRWLGWKFSDKDETLCHAPVGGPVLRSMLVRKYHELVSRGPSLPDAILEAIEKDIPRTLVHRTAYYRPALRRRARIYKRKVGLLDAVDKAYQDRGIRRQMRRQRLVGSLAVPSPREALLTPTSTPTAAWTPSIQDVAECYEDHDGDFCDLDTVDPQVLSSALPAPYGSPTHSEEEKVPSLHPSADTHLVQQTQNPTTQDSGPLLVSHAALSRAAEESDRILEHILQAYCILDPEVSYCQGMNFIAGTLLSQMGEELGFWSMACIFLGIRAPEHPLLLVNYVPNKGSFVSSLAANVHTTHRALGHRIFCLPNLAGMRICKFQFEVLLRATYPLLSEHLGSMGFRVDIVTEWFMTLFSIPAVQNRTILRIWDYVMASGMEAVFRVALAVFARQQARLLQMREFEEAYTLLKHCEAEVMGDADELLACAERVQITAYQLNRLRGFALDLGATGLP